jgi:hypothetical protein
MEQIMSEATTAYKTHRKPGESIVIKLGDEMVRIYLEKISEQFAYFIFIAPPSVKIQRVETDT